MSTEKWFSRADRTLGSEPEAIEVPVEVSGASVAGAAGARELFSEDTLTTLVFDDGAVVRLSAAIAVGQMLFLKHKMSQKEIVTRVLRQRSFGAGNAYVELEFAEPAAGFWTAAPAAPAPPSNQDVAHAPLNAAGSRGAVALAKTEPHLYELLSNSTDDQASAPPVTNLGTQLSALLENESPRPQPVATPKRSADTPVPSMDFGDLQALLSPPQQAATTAAVGEVVAGRSLNLQDGPAASAEAETSAHREETGEAQNSTEEQPEELTAGSLEPNEDGASAAKKIVELPALEGAAAKTLARTRLLAAALVLVSLTGVGYEKGFLGDWFSNHSVAASTGGAVRPLSIKRQAAKGAPGDHGSPATDSKSGSASTASDTGTDATATGALNAAAADPTRSGEEAALRKQARSTGTEGAAKHGAAMVSTSTEDPTSPADDVDGYEPPKLVKAVNAVPPPEAVQNFVTGDVKFDAAVDASGKVSSANVISGPAPLHAAALEALKRYQYKPAIKNGQAVAGHVTVSVKFWYEP
ncbi:MAG: energy transducer TonB [Candidatus Acidiferrum sp.]|jgi:TonB family protein